MSFKLATNNGINHTSTVDLLKYKNSIAKVEVVRIADSIAKTKSDTTVIKVNVDFSEKNKS